MCENHFLTVRCTNYIFLPIRMLSHNIMSSVRYLHTRDSYLSLLVGRRILWCIHYPGMIEILTKMKTTVRAFRSLKYRAGKKLSTMFSVDATETAWNLFERQKLQCLHSRWGLLTNSGSSVKY